MRLSRFFCFNLKLLLFAGVSKEACAVLPKLLEAALQAIEGCPCTDGRGCPSCVQSPRCSEHNIVMDKPAAKLILRLLLGKQTTADAD